jgi:hypothetical protein
MAAGPDGEDGDVDEAATAPTTRIPRTTAEVAQLRVERGLVDAKITCQPGLGDLLHGQWRRAPAIAADDGAVTLTFPRRWFTRWKLGRRSDQIALGASVPWDISIQGGVCRVGADVSGLKLRSFSVAGSASHLTLVLGRPNGEVPINLRSADRLTILRPADVQLRIQVKGGGAQLQIDDQKYGALGGSTVLTTGPVLHNFFNVTVHGVHRFRVTTI